MMTVLGCVIVISGASAMDSILPQTLFQVVSLLALAIASLRHMDVIVCFT